MSIASVQATLAQSVKGIVMDAYSLGPIPGAEVLFDMLGEQKAVQTNAEGRYSIDLTTAGRYQIRIQKDQYQSILLTDVQVNTGRTLLLQHELTPSPFDLETIVVKANDTWSPIQQLQTEVIGIEETERVAANFQDPARVASGYAGIVSLNDQANHLIVRGLSPMYSKWYLEGMEIVNPNHTNNAGTLSDGPTQAGGGVNMFPAQILGNTFLSKGAHPVNYSNALGGILDMHYGKPDNQSFNITPNISLIGVELKAEGPFTEGGQNSWQLNYRYSTVGLLSAMGVPLGDEDISYSDLHIQTSFATGSKGTLQAFGFYGNDKNEFNGSTDSTEWEFDKDQFNIDYANKIGGLGLRHTYLIGGQSVLTSGVIYSSNEASRSMSPSGQNSVSDLRLVTDKHQKISSFINFQKKQTNNLRLSAGLQFQWYKDENMVGEKVKNPTLISSNRLSEGSIIRPNASLTYQASRKLLIEPSLAFSYFTSNEQAVLEPGLRMTYVVSNSTGMTLAYQRRSQAAFQPLNTIRGESVVADAVFPTESNQLSLDVEYRSSNYSSLKGSVFFTQLKGAYVYEDGTYYSQLFDAYSIQRAFPVGQERNYGIELTYQLKNESGSFFSSNATFYKSEVLRGDTWQSSRFDGGYVFNVQGGKEFVKISSTHKRTLGISVRGTYFGGIRERPIDDVSSRLKGETVFRLFSGYTEQLADYFRPDLSIYILKNKPNKTTRWYLDIQNVASIQNEGFHYFDAFQDQKLVKNQLGIIPILGWRAEF